MSAFNTFFLLFKNDASKSKQDIADLEKQIESLRVKGKARSAQETTEMNDAVKRQKELQKQNRDSGDTYEKLGTSIVGAAAAYVSFNAIKSGITNTADFNRQLSIQAKTLGLNTQEMRAYGAAVQKAGGSQEWMGGFLNQQSRAYASVGLKFNAEGYFKSVQAAMNAASNDTQKIALLDAFGIEDDGARLLLMENRFMGAAAAANEFAKSSESADKAARDFGASTDELGQSIKSYWSEVGAVVLPAMTSFNSGLSDFISGVSESKSAVSTSFNTITVAALALASVVPGISKTWFGFLAGFAAKLGAVGVAAYALNDVVKDLFNGTRDSFIGKASRFASGRIDRVWDGRDGPSDIENWSKKRTAAPASGRTGDTGGDGMQFWMSQGYTRAQAAGIMANEKHESSHNPMARGDGGAAHGLYQWHPDRRAKILAGTGIDVSTASAMDQRRAASWEMKNEPIFSDEVFRTISSPDKAAAYFSMKYERPADVHGAAMQRARTAMDMASDASLGISGGSSSSSSIKIDKIEVNTQATDAQGIANDIGSELTRELGYSYGNLDDGVAG